MALSSVTRSVTCTENLTFRLDQLMLLIHIYINGREATVCLRRETIRGGGGGGRRISRRRRRVFLGTEHARLAKSTKHDGYCSGGKKRETIPSNKRKAINHKHASFNNNINKKSWTASVISASPSSQQQLAGHCLGNKQTHSIVLKSSAAGQLPTRAFG